MAFSCCILSTSLTIYQFIKKFLIHFFIREKEVRRRVEIQHLHIGNSAIRHLNCISLKIYIFHWEIKKVASDVDETLLAYLVCSKLNYLFILELSISSNFE